MDREESPLALDKAEKLIMEMNLDNGACFCFNLSQLRRLRNLQAENEKLKKRNLLNEGSLIRTLRAENEKLRETIIHSGVFLVWLRNWLEESGYRAETYFRCGQLIDKLKEAVDAK